MANPIEGNTNSWFNRKWWERPWVKNIESYLTDFPQLGGDSDFIQAFRDRILINTDIRPEILDKLMDVPVNLYSKEENIGGYFDPNSNEISINRYHEDALPEILRHEYAHAYSFPNKNFYTKNLLGQDVPNGRKPWPFDSSLFEGLYKSNVGEWAKLIDELKNVPEYTPLYNDLQHRLKFYPPNLNPQQRAEEEFAFMSDYVISKSRYVPSRFKEWFKKYLTYDKPTGFREEFTPYVEDYLPNAR